MGGAVNEWEFIDSKTESGVIEIRDWGDKSCEKTVSVPIDAIHFYVALRLSSSMTL